MIKLLIILPAYNEEKVIGKVLKSLPRKINQIIKVDLLVVDDGSTDDTQEICRSCNVLVIHHLINRGLGAALCTGFTYAVNHHYNYVVTFDADGQHSPSDIGRLLKPLLSKTADVVIGSRMLNLQSMPLTRRFVNFFSNLITLLFYKIWTTDSQSGLRGFTLSALQKIRVRTQRMEVSSEIFKEISRHHLIFAEVPISSLYTNYSLQKGQRITNAPNVFYKLLLNNFR